MSIFEKDLNAITKNNTILRINQIRKIILKNRK